MMPEENLANDQVEDLAEPENMDWQAKAQEYQAQLSEARTRQESLEQSYKSVQRELNKARTQGGQTAQLTGKLAAIERQINALTAVLSADTALDDDARSLLLQTRAETEQQEKQAETQRRRGAEIASVLQEAGVTDWEDPRIHSVLDAWNDGDYTEALREARRVKRELSAAPAMNVEELISAAVEKALKQSGARRVDNNSGNPSGGNPFRRENLPGQLAQMTRDEILRNVAQINEVN